MILRIALATIIVTAVALVLWPGFAAVATIAAVVAGSLVELFARGRA